MEPQTRTTELVGKTIAIVRTVASNPGIGLSQVARKLGIPKATVLRILTSLQNERIVEQDDRKTYSLGIGGVIFSPFGMKQSQVDAQITFQIRALAREVGETCGLDLFVGGSVVVIAQAPGPKVIGQIPTRVPFSQEAWCTATGRLFLSRLPHDELLTHHSETLEKFRTARPRRNLLDELKTLQAKNYSFVEGELVKGASAVAVPVNDAKRMIAAVWAGGPTDRFRTESIATMVTFLSRTAETVGKIISASSHWHSSNERYQENV